MIQSLETMRRRIGSAEDLHAMVRVMKALAATNIRQCEKAVESLAAFRVTIEEGLQIVLHSKPDAIPFQAEPGTSWAMVVFGSDQGMCGSFNEQVASFALKQMETLQSRATGSVLAVGARVAGHLKDAGCAVRRRFPAPGAVEGITDAVHDVLLEIEQLRLGNVADQVLLVHHRPADPSGYRPDSLQLLPIDAGWLQRLAARKWVSRSLPTFTMDWRELFSALVRHHAFVALYQAFAESMAGENASRLTAMLAAQDNIEEHLSQLTASFHQQRQKQIMEELLDIIAGFESLEQEEAGRKRKQKKSS